MSFEGCPPLIPRSDPNLVVPTLEIQFAEHLRTYQLIQKIIQFRDRKMVLEILFIA